MIGLHIPTTLDWNGPSVKINSSPSNVSTATSSSVLFTASGSSFFPEGQTTFATNTGSVSYQWYDQNGIVEDQNRTNTDPRTTTTTISGATTANLSIVNCQYEQDNGRNFYCQVAYDHSAYGTSDPIVAGTARSTGNAINEPLDTTIGALTVKTYISITLQPTPQTDASTEVFAVFNITADTIVDTDDTLLTYQWRLDEVNIANSANAQGVTTNTLRIKAAEGTHTIDCVVSHINADPGSVTSDQVSYVTVDPRRIVNIETVDTSFENSNNPNAPLDGVRVWTSSNNLNNGPINLYGTPITYPNTPTSMPASRLIFVYAPEKDLDVVVEMGGASGQKYQVGGGDVQGGQGGWGAFRMTLKQNEEYSFKLGPKDGRFGPTGGLVTGTPVRGGAGGGLAVMYRGNKAIAVLGGGGGAGSQAAGGDGGGFNQPGENGFGRSGGGGAPAQGPQPGSGGDRSHGQSDQGGALGACPNPSDGNQQNWMAQQGLGACADYTASGYFVPAVGDAKGEAVTITAELKRGFRTGLGGRHNGGWARTGSVGGGGGSGSAGGWASRGNGNGGGGGSGWADPAEVTVLNTRPGVQHDQDAFARIRMYDPDEPVPVPSQPSPPSFRSVSWNDGRSPGYKWGTYGVGGDDQTVPGATVRGPRGLNPNPSNNRDLAGWFSNYRSGVSGSGMFFAPNDASREDISYIVFDFQLKDFGPREEDMYLWNNHFYGVNGSTRKRYTRHQSVVDRHPDRYTTSKSEAWVPFRLDIEMIFLCAYGGNYRILEKTWSWDYDYYHRKDLEFTASDLGRANNLNPDGSGRIHFPDAGSGSGTTRVNYAYPRIHSLKANIWNKDTRSWNNINVFVTSTDSDDEARRDNWFEFGRSIIT